MAVHNLRQDTPATKCGKDNVYTGCVLARVFGNNKRNAEAAAEAEATNEAQQLMNQDRAKACPAGCHPGRVQGRKTPKVTKLLSVKLPQDNDRWVAYFTAHWQVTIACPAAEED